MLLLVLAALFVVVDRVSWYMAERGLATSLQRSGGLAQRPEVSIAGFPLLTQAVRGRYRQVDVHLRDVPADRTLRLDELETRLVGVHLPLRSLVEQTNAPVPVDVAESRSRVSFANLEAATAARIPTDQLTVSYGAGTTADRVSVAGQYRTIVGTLRLQAEARLTVVDGGLVVTLLPDTITGVPPFLRGQVAALFGFNSALPPFPWGFQARSVQVARDGVTVLATSDSLVLGETAAS